MSEFVSLGSSGTSRYVGLETFLLAAGVYDVTYNSDEVTAICPVTQQPDQYTVSITLRDAKYGLESKSLKLYLQTFRNEGVFCEALAARIAHEVRKPTEANETIVTVEQKRRGGIRILATCSLGKEK